MNKPNPSANPISSGPTTHHPLSDAGVIRIAGEDRIEFLQGQLTVDVAKLPPDRPRLAGWASPKGRLLLAGWLFDWNDAHWLVVPEALVAAAAQRLRMFVLRSRVEIDAPDVGITVAAAPDANETLSEDSAIDGCLINENIYQFRPVAGHPFLLRIAPDPVEQDTGPAPADRDWRLANIRNGLPSVYPETREAFVPQMLNLDLLGGISFDKGCYVGQEIVARTQNLGRIKRRMYRFGGPAGVSVAPGATVYAGDDASGRVVDAVETDDGLELLAVLRIESLGEPVSLDPEGRLALERRALPYEVPEKL